MTFKLGRYVEYWEAESIEEVSGVSDIVTNCMNFMMRQKSNPWYDHSVGVT